MEQEQGQDRRSGELRREFDHLGGSQRRILVEQRHGVGRRVQIRRIAEILVVRERRIPAHRRAGEQRRSGVNRRLDVRRIGHERRESNPPGTSVEDPAT